MQKQKKALINSLVFVVENLEESERLTKYLRNLGARHVAYGTEKEHYRWVGQTLLKTLAHFFKQDWTNSLQDNWAEAYSVIADVMLEGAARVAPDSHDVLGKARDVARSLVAEAVETCFDEELSESVRERVRKLIYEALDEEGASILQELKAS